MGSEVVTPPHSLLPSVNAWHAPRNRAQQFVRYGSGARRDGLDGHILAEKRRLVADAGRNVGHIDHDLIHRDAPHNRSAFFVEKHLAAVGKRAQVAVGVTGGQNRDF